MLILLFCYFLAEIADALPQNVIKDTKLVGNKVDEPGIQLPTEVVKRAIRESVPSKEKALNVNENSVIMPPKNATVIKKDSPHLEKEQNRDSPGNKNLILPEKASKTRKNIPGAPVAKLDENKDKLKTLNETRRT